jgi:hypothetical protein
MQIAAHVSAQQVMAGSLPTHIDNILRFIGLYE